MLQKIVCICWLITVISIWLPDLLKNQFFKKNESKIIKLLVTISAIVTIYYAFF